ncbi:MAG: DUF58 domain-containing protein, partial [Planctomycetes bacterium]|nr:DUF58 domain-containing protein [Planctomycetota bacterium]
HLDWKVLSRTDRYYVKQYEEETNLSANILLDCSGSMDYGSEDTITKFEYGCYLAALLSYLLIRQRDSVGLVLFDDRIRLRMPPRSTAMHLNEMMKQLERCQPGQPTRVAGIFHDLAETFKRRCLIIIISDLYDEPEAVLRAFAHFRHKKHDVIVYHVLDKSELELDFDQVFNLVDQETGEKLQVDPAFVREDYRQRIQEFIDTYRRACRQSGVDYITTDTQVPYDLMLTAYLDKRARLK